MPSKRVETIFRSPGLLIAMSVSWPGPRRMARFNRMVREGEAIAGAAGVWGSLDGCTFDAKEHFSDAAMQVELALHSSPLMHACTCDSHFNGICHANPRRTRCTTGTRAMSYSPSFSYGPLTGPLCTLREIFLVIIRHALICLVLCLPSSLQA